MSQERSSGFYLPACLLAGFVLGIAGAARYDGFLHPIVQSYLGLFGLQRHDQIWQSFGAVLAIWALAAAAFGLFYLVVVTEAEGPQASVEAAVILFVFFFLVSLPMVPIAVVAWMSHIAGPFGSTPTFAGALAS